MIGGQRKRSSAKERGVNLVGYLNHVLGLGESARQFAGALRAGRIAHACAALDLGDGAPRLPGADTPWLGEAELPFELTILWCNPDRYGIDIDPDGLPGDLIGRWAWELSELPEGWAHAARSLASVWTASEFVRAAVERAVDLPVRVMPSAIDAPLVPPLERVRWNLDPDRRLFLFMFDYHSVAARKNPLGVIEAFKRAFSDGQQAALLIKTINASTMPEAAAQVEAAAAELPSARVVDRALPRDQNLALIAGCDCYVSLHRSEGFGMSIAEAMAYGRPVIATDYGGNVDFLDKRTGYPVAWRPAAVGVGNPAYPVDATWAEPDLDQAAALMRRVARAPWWATLRGRRAARRMRRRHSALAVGRRIAHELKREASSSDDRKSLSPGRSAS